MLTKTFEAQNVRMFNRKVAHFDAESPQGAPAAAMGRPRMSHKSLNSSTSRGSPSKETAISSRPGLLCDGKYLDPQISENFGILNLLFCKTSVKLSQFQV